jgi:hypothetical protein
MVDFFSGAASQEFILRDELAHELQPLEHQERLKIHGALLQFLPIAFLFSLRMAGMI